MKEKGKGKTESGRSVDKMYQDKLGDHRLTSLRDNPNSGHPDNQQEWKSGTGWYCDGIYQK